MARSGRPVRDYVGIATAYAEEAVADKKGKTFGKWIRLAGKRFLADLKRAKRNAVVRENSGKLGKAGSNGILVGQSWGNTVERPGDFDVGVVPRDCPFG